MTIIHRAAFAVLTMLALSACSSGIEVSHDRQEAGPDKNALLIQADFPGHVMTGVAYSVSKDLDVFNLRPLIPRRRDLRALRPLASARLRP